MDGNDAVRADEVEGVEGVTGRKRKRYDEELGSSKKRMTGGSDLKGNESAGSNPSNDNGEEDGSRESAPEFDSSQDDKEHEEEDSHQSDGGSDDDDYGIDDGEDEDQYHESLHEDYDEFEGFPWLKCIDLSIKSDTSVDDRPIAHCHAKLIDRDSIRATFYQDMEEPTHDTCELAFDVFDRWGCLKSELRDHPVKKGTGVWGVELDKSKFVFIEDVVVDDKDRRKGYGRKLVEQVWNKAQSMANDCDFAIAFAMYNNTRAVEEKAESLAPNERELYQDELLRSIEDFWHALGFRRIGSSFYFARAKDASHPSHSLPAADDYKRPSILRHSSSGNDQVFPYDKAIIQSNDAETLELLKARLRDHPVTDPVWLSLDRHGNNILHVTARDGKAESVLWLLMLPISGELRPARNLKGETPLEGLQQALESRRTMRRVALRTIPIADYFEGFAPTEVKCVQYLKGFKNPTPSQLAQFTYGCTCKNCLGGFMSPRLAFALECQGDMNHDMLNDMLDGGIWPMSGPEWCEWNEYHFDHLGPGIKSNLATNQALRQGFTNIFGYVGEAIRAKKVPTSTAVLENADSEWPPCTKNYLQRGGTVAAVVLDCFDGAMLQDQYLGDGEHQLLFQEEYIDKLPTCRNDGEFVFASRQYRAMEGLPNEPEPEVGLRSWIVRALTSGGPGK